jgi:hypothetical protein
MPMNNGAPNFLEIESVEDACKVDLEVYTFIKYSDSRNRYLFKKRFGR